MFTLSLIISAAFTALLLSLLFPRKKGENEIVFKGLSVIIPFRNEEENLSQLLHTLSSQKCSLPYEVILINDSSTDCFESTLEHACSAHPQISFSLLHLTYDSDVPLTSKQQALDLGVDHSTYDWLIFTDADMYFTPNWLESLVQSARAAKQPFVFGRTSLRYSNIFSLLQYLQLTFLFSVAWLFSKGRIQSSCMGNNILLHKELYMRIGGQKGIGYTITEDQGLMASLKKYHVTPQPTRPFTAEAFTLPEVSYRGYIHQLLRWAKGGARGSIQLMFAMILIASYLLLGVVALYSGVLVPLVIPTVILLLYLAIGFTASGSARSLFFLPLTLFWVGVQLLLFPLALITIKPQWKGRNL